MVISIDLSPVAVSGTDETTIISGTDETTASGTEDSTASGTEETTASSVETIIIIPGEDALSGVTSRLDNLIVFGFVALLLLGVIAFLCFVHRD